MCRLAPVLLFLVLLANPSLKAQETLNPTEAANLAGMMCRQLPNLTSLADAVISSEETRQQPARELPVWDDVYDALIALGQYSVPCLVDELMDVRWMPDPRMEPLAGAPLVGDIAYVVLSDKGVPDLLPILAGKKPDQLRMDDYFLWPSMADNRLRLQEAVRNWVLEHPDCCAAQLVTKKQPASKTSPDMPLTRRTQFLRLRPGMTSAQILSLVGKPDAEEGSDAEEPLKAAAENIHLLGVASADRNEKRAYIYFTERWTTDIAYRNPLRERYLILYFTPHGRLTRMFSNVAKIPPIFPRSEASWEHLMWEEPDSTAKPSETATH